MLHSALITHSMSLAFDMSVPTGGTITHPSHPHHSHQQVPLPLPTPLRPQHFHLLSREMHGLHHHPKPRRTRLQTIPLVDQIQPRPIWSNRTSHPAFLTNPSRTSSDFDMSLISMTFLCYTWVTSMYFAMTFPSFPQQ